MAFDISLKDKDFRNKSQMESDLLYQCVDAFWFHLVTINIVCFMKYNILFSHQSSHWGFADPITWQANADYATTLQWRHNRRDSALNHQPHDCLVNRYSDADQRKH